MPATIKKQHVSNLRRKNSRIFENNVGKLQYPSPPTPDEMTLPKLPVPSLQETIDKYLLCVKPLVNEAQFEQTKKVAEQFIRSGAEGEKIQSRLKEIARTRENWAYEWWLNDMYLDARVPLPINSNPGMVLPKQSFQDQENMLRYASKLVSGILDFKVILDARALPIDVARGQLAGQCLCMEQYYRLLSSYRLPGVGRDKLVSVKADPIDDGEHVVVMCNNQLFVLPISEDGIRLTEADFQVQLDKILHDANNCQSHDSPVGVLTSLNRDDWAEARESLIKDHVNRLSLDAVERCVFVLCLDQSVNANNDVTMARQMLYGSGSKWNGCNRWYDKTIQIIISADGNIGLSYEHSASEGIAVTALIEHLIKYVSIQDSKGLYISNSIKNLSAPRHLKWKLCDSVEKYIRVAQSQMQHTADNLDLEILRFSDYGKSFIKRQNISPDAFVQVALQLTYYKLYQRLVSTYESASTRRFREGRVDNIRAATLQALDFAKSLTEPDEGGKIKVVIGKHYIQIRIPGANSFSIRPDLQDAKKMLLLRRAVKAQTDITIAAITGHGIDCHLLGLKKMAEDMKIEEPEIFKDPSYALCNYFQLSTSQIPTKTDSFMCYGAVVPDGYGVSYNPHDDSITFCLSSFRSCPSTSSEKFTTALRESLHVMKDICQRWNRRRSSSLEHLSSPRKLSLHQSINIRSFSIEGDHMREESVTERNDDVIRSSTIRKYFAEQRSVTSAQLLPRKITIDRIPGPFCNRLPRPNRFKLNRRFSDLAINRSLVRHPAEHGHQVAMGDPPVSAELMEVLRQQRQVVLS